MLFRIFLPLLLALSAQQSTSETNWEKTIKERREGLVRQNGVGTDAALRDRLLAMRDRDQEARGMHSGDAKDGQQHRQVGNLSEVDLALTAEMKQVAETRGWPTIRLVGIEASNAAMLILTHSPDHAWQRSLLPQLEELADAGRIDGSALALVIDKELVASGKLQRYGSQFKLVNGAMAMYAVEDPAGLDQRRAQVQMPPMDAYKARLMEIYHLKVSNQIVSATANAQP